LAAHIDIRGVPAARARLNLQFVAVRKGEPLDRQELIEVLLVGLAVLLEVLPSTCNVCSSVKDDDALVERVAWRVLLDHAHDSADELHKRRQIPKDAKHRGYSEEPVVKAFPKLSNLHDDIELVVLQLLQHA
jgi:hypothetical protein